MTVRSLSLSLSLFFSLLWDLFISSPLVKRDLPLLVNPPMRTIVFESKATDAYSSRPLQLAEEVTRDQVDPLSILLHTSFLKAKDYIIKATRD
jgi:hypothetical protein